MPASKFVYFDLGNVLVTFDHRIAAENLARVCARDFEEVMSKMFVTDLQHRYETGLVTSEQYAAEINREFDCQVPQEVILEAISDMFQPNWPILEVLQQVREAGVEMGILSNTCEAHWNWLMDRDWPMLKAPFCPVILSYEVNSMKPDSGIYAACERASGRSATQIFFTDDRAENIAAAQQRGWKTHLFTTAEDLMPNLQRWLLG